MSNQGFQKQEAEYVSEIRELRAELEQLKQTNAKLTNSVVETHNLIEANVKLEAELSSIQDALKFQGMKADSLEAKLEQTMADANAMAEALGRWVDEYGDLHEIAREALTQELQEKYLNATKGIKNE